MRRCNIRITGVAEGPGCSSTASISKMLKEIPRLDRDIVVDRSHRGSLLKYPAGPLIYQGNPVAIFPDFTMGVVKAWSAFNEAWSLLQGWRDVRYGLIYPAKLHIFQREQYGIYRPRESNNIHHEHHIPRVIWTELLYQPNCTWSHTSLSCPGSTGWRVFLLRLSLWLLLQICSF